jgi:hypothetical protein
MNLKMRNPTGWLSLSAHIELADALFGGAGRRLLTAWLEEQVARIGRCSIRIIFAFALGPVASLGQRSCWTTASM